MKVLSTEFDRAEIYHIGPLSVASTWVGCAAVSVVLSVVCAPTARASVFNPAPSRVLREHTKRGNWRLDSAQDRFSGETACQLRSHNDKAIYRASAVGIHFKNDRDLSGAVYRIDDALVQTERNDLPRLIELWRADRSWRDDACRRRNSLGPLERLVDARIIAIEPQPGRGARLFELHGMAALHAIAVARGRVPESRFVDR